MYPSNFSVAVFCVIGLSCLVVVRSQLIVNVKTQGGEVIKETITANVSDDSVVLEFPQNDGTYVTQLIDFKQELQIFKVIVLGEEELGQSQYQVMCFIMRFFKSNFISSDAMSKLRQKNPGTVRSPEEDRRTEDVELDVSVDVSASSILSPHIPHMCSLAQTSTYASDQDIKLWATQRRELDGDWSLVSDATHHLPTRGVARCGDGGRDLSNPCACHYQVCIPWYPCGLKYCKGRDNSGKAVSYRCGIRTCRKCRNFGYFVPQRHQCLWDD